MGEDPRSVLGRILGHELPFELSPYPHTVASSGRGTTGAVAVALCEHAHEWTRIPETVGLFMCTDGSCLWCAVCPGCLGSLDVALRARSGIAGLALYWCPAHWQGRVLL